MNTIPFVYQMPDKQQDVIDKTNQVCYDNYASTWDRFPFPHIIPTFFEKYYNPSLGKKVLDVGSGTGILAKWLADQGFELLCLDPSQEMIRFCRAKGLKTEHCTIQEYKPKETYAIILAILSLIHVPKADFSSQLKKLADALPKDGLLLLGMLEGQGEGFQDSLPCPRFFAFYTPDEIKQYTKNDFELMDYDYVKNNGIGYMLFALKKR